MTGQEARIETCAQILVDRGAVVAAGELRTALAALVAERDRYRGNFIALFDAIDAAQKFDNTGGDSAVYIALAAWDECRAALAVSTP